MSEDWTSLLDSCGDLEEESEAATVEEPAGAIEQEEEDEEEELEYGYSLGEEYSYDYAEEGSAYVADWASICEEFSLNAEGEQPTYLVEILSGNASALFTAIRSEQLTPPGPSSTATLETLRAIAEAEDERQERIVDILCVVGGGGEGEMEYVSPETGHSFELSALQVAAAQGSLPWLQFILETYLKTAEAAELINYQCPGSFYSALHLACKREGDRSDIVQLLLDANAATEAVDMEYRTPLHLACMAGNADVVETLLSSETSLSYLMAKDNTGLTALHHAAFGQFEALTIVTEWIETVCTSSDEPLLYAEVLQEMTDEKGRTALHAAACCCSIEILAVLLEGGMDINGLDSQGRNVLHWAVSGGSVKASRDVLNKEELELCLTYCITQGAKLDVKDSSGRTPLHLAAFYKHRHACEYFLTQHHRKAGVVVDSSASTIATNSNTAVNPGSEEEESAQGEMKENSLAFQSEDSASDVETVGTLSATEGAAVKASAAVAAGEPLRCFHVMDVDALGRNAFHYSVALGSDSLRVLLQAVGADNGLGLGLADLMATDYRGQTPLHIAAMNGHEDAVLVLLKKLSQNTELLKKSVLALDKRKRGVAFYCAHFGMEEAVAKVFKAVEAEHWAELFTVDTLGKTLFHAAAASGVGKILVSLQEHSSEELFEEQTQLQDEKGRSPVHYACACGHEIAVRWFIAQVGVEAVLRADKNGDIPAFYAAYFGQTHCMRELINTSDSKLTMEHSNAMSQSIFHAAAAGGAGEMVNLLLEIALSLGTMEAMTSKEDADGCSPLLIAAMGGFTYVADTLRQCGAQVGSRDSEGRSIFHFAISTGNAQLLFALLTEVSFDAELVNAQDSNGHTPLHYSAFCGDADCMSMLLSCSEVDPSIRDHSGRHALTVSASLGDDHLCSLLLGHARVDVLSQDEKGRTALDAAAFEGHVESLQELVTHLLSQRVEGVTNKDLSDKRGRTPLHAAANSGHLEACMMLVDKLQLPIDGQDSKGRTALHYATAAGHVQCVMGLLELGADASKTDAKGMRPVELAEQRQHEETSAVLNAMA